MSDFERYSDYNEYEDDIEKRSGIIGLVLKIVATVVCLSVVGLIGFRLIIFNNYPDSIENIHFNDKLTAHYETTGGNIGALTQSMRADYDDPDEGNFFCGNLIVIPDINQLQLSVRFNTSLMESIKQEYGVELDPDAENLFEFCLAVLPLSKNDGTAYPTGELTYVGRDSRMMYRYYKLVFDNVDLSLDGESEIWIRLEITVNGVKMEKPYMILVYEDTSESAFEEYELSKKERP